MKIYTSYFGFMRKLDEGIVPICIARYKPKFYEGLWMTSVAPTPYMLSDECGREEYVSLYNDILKNVGAERIVAEINDLSGGRDAALLCYERVGFFCHRHLLADFLNRELGIGVCEYGGCVRQDELF